MDRGDQAKRTRNENIFNCLYKNPEATFKLICFPWAGSGSVHFAKWGQDTHDSLEVHSLRLPGRESRIEEPFANDISQLVDEVVCALQPVIQDKQFAFFGHSMGSYIAFRTALHLKENNKPEPLHLFLSSATPIHSKAWSRIPKEDELSEEQISHYLTEFGGTPKHFVEDKEFVQQYSPMIRADVNLISSCTSNIPSKGVLSCDLTCFVGSEDIAKDIEAWKDVTSGNTNIHQLPGDHFYLLDPANERLIKNYIIKCLEVSSLVNF
ncbi:S-acyl fatty acid synthase thioesterase, medium chain [Trachypithecus francoisi]|uniref:S-acyl fatty acid synthase thioesterase, medium chain n=1 Tax=Trachypithecus francoisi TaxID=54180 RepID=UPI00141B720C|nr:S-acyl fatty acid synthase thioesterase, medium chain [Trachypithecus francoisi]XP_033065458.1 S-acyl fatty acid synthase thioesterase, medium chain [Trachypithecus francoisi]